MKFEKQSFNNLTTFFDAIKGGHAFCGNMNDNDEPFTTKYKTERNFAYTNLVVVDMQSTLTPTYVYTSFSHAPQ